MSFLMKRVITHFVKFVKDEAVTIMNRCSLDAFGLIMPNPSIPHVEKGQELVIVCKRSRELVGLVSINLVEMALSGMLEAIIYSQPVISRHMILFCLPLEHIHILAIPRHVIFYTFNYEETTSQFSQCSFACQIG